MSMVDAVLGSGRTLDDGGGDGLEQARLASLDPRDALFARSIVVVTLRRLGTIRHALATLVDRSQPKKLKPVETILIVGAAQLLFMDVPDHAAVDLAVRAARLDARSAPLAALVNGVLRNVAREREKLLDGGAALERDTPPWLAVRWRRTWGEATARAVAQANREPAAIDLTVKADAAAWAEKLGGHVLPTGSVRLSSTTPVIELEGFDEGAFWVQDAAAAIPARLLRTGPGTRVLDLCAAPGGKTAQLCLSGADVVALDRSATRLKRLSENLQRLDYTADVVVADALTYNGAGFDAVLLDAPCLATGTIRRHPDVAWTKRPGDLVTLAPLQAKMFDRAAALVKPGGLLVYCTCSIEPEEGEHQIAALLRRNPDMRRLPIEPGECGLPAEAIDAQGDFRTLPSMFPASEGRRGGIDGFFATRLQRRG